MGSGFFENPIAAPAHRIIFFGPRLLVFTKLAHVQILREGSVRGEMRKVAVMANGVEVQTLATRALTGDPAMRIGNETYFSERGCYYRNHGSATALGD